MPRRSESAGITRREAIRQLGTASAGMVLAGPAVRWRASSLRVRNRAVDVVAASVSPATLRISVLADGDRTAQPIPLDGALAASDWTPQATVAAGETATVGTFRVRVEADPVRVVVSRPDGRTIQEIEVDEATGSASFGMGRGPLLGMGQGGPQFDRRGSSYTMRWGQGGYELRTHGGVVPIQWFVSTDGWALWIHQPLGTVNLAGERGVFEPPDDAPLPLDMFVIDAADPVAIMGEWARLTGQPEMPPLWSFGYHQSHRTLAGPEEVLQVAEAFREKRLPCDTLIYLGTGFTPAGWNTNNGEFRWNPVTFPDADAVLEQLRALNYHVVLHVVLEGRRLTGALDDPCPDPPAPGETGSGQTWPEEQQVSCYWPIHNEIIEQGIDGFWPDQGDGLDARSRLNRIRMYWDGMRAARPDERMFALHRNGHAGMARYAPFLWSGDVYTTWETLRTHISVAINTGLSGIPYWGTDIGGFVPTPEYTGELHVRWFQFGSFCPLFRAHGRTWHLRLPWGWNTGQLGHDELSNYRGGAGYSDPSELSNPAVEPACRKYLELRYRLMPYLYTAVRETHDRGLPIMRSLWLHYPDDSVAAARGDEYLWGRDILVAPVVEPGARRRTLYLPRGLWYDFWTETPVDGGREIARAVDLETTPLYVRAGAVIPMGPVKQYTAEPVDEPVELVVHPGADGESFLYEDDGHTFGYQRDEWMRVVLTWTDSSRRLALRLDEGSGRRDLPRTFRVRVAGSEEVREVRFEGTAIEIAV
jgi:alpha-glucosidase/alpha-D-xyloside xylohydrolase